MSDSRSLKEMKMLLQTCAGFDSQQTRKFYNSWAETYEHDVGVLKCRAPFLVADVLKANLPENHENAQVLDVGCGSGLVAKQMSELGFRNFVGVDSSEGMLQQAAKTGLYRDLKLALLGTEPLPAQTGTFDVVIAVGVLGAGFAPVSVVRELCSATKPGGLVCILKGNHTEAAEEEFHVDLETELRLMEDEGLWHCVARTSVDQYMIDVNDGSGKEAYLSGNLYLYMKPSHR